MASSISSSSSQKVHALITGPPGIGKTTLVRAVCKRLQETEETSALHLCGFVTEEVRGSGRSGRGPRVGFDVVTLTGERGTLARIESDREAESVPSRDRRPTVGRYSVHMESFEQLALPTLQQSTNTGDSQTLFVIDEVGKMELFSRSFVDSVRSLFHSPANVIMATIPVARHKSHWLVEELRKRKDCKLFEVNEKNRNELVEEIAEFLKINYTKRRTS